MGLVHDTTLAAFPSTASLVQGAGFYEFSGELFSTHSLNSHRTNFTKSCWSWRRPKVISEL
jgi:hypothetical protein